MSEQKDSLTDRPPPSIDPTTLTTQALIREITSVRELIEEKISSTEKLSTEKFSKVQTQFALIERQRVEQKKDTKDAVDAALAAAKEAVKEQTISSEKAISKSETATNELIKSQNINQTTEAKSLRREIGDLKDRITTIESQKSGADSQKNETRDNRSGLIAIVGIGITIILAFLTIAAFVIANT